MNSALVLLDVRNVRKVTCPSMVLEQSFQGLPLARIDFA
jgi:hypothetical protein